MKCSLHILSNIFLRASDNHVLHVLFISAYNYLIHRKTVAVIEKWDVRIKMC